MIVRSIFLFFLLTIAVLAQSGITTVTIKEGQTVRDLAREYLNNANLWTEILKLNGLKSITDVKAGMTLKIPSGAVQAADKELLNAQRKIQEATAAGATLFTPELIAQAIKKKEDAQSKKNNKDWAQAESLAREAQEIASRSLEECKKKNNVSAQAILSQRLGNVQGRTSNDLVWLDTPLKAQLSEGHKVRTLSQSFAEISFKDASKLVLNANSQAVIQKMRVNVLENKQESKVSLIEGDIYALLSGNKKKKVSVDIGGVEAKINADRFWFNKTGKDLRVASYGGSIELYQDGKTIIIGENKGTIIGTNTSKTEETELLESPLLNSPEQNTTVFKSDKKNEITFKWTPIKGAVRYWIEIANDNSSFSDLIFSQDNIGKNEFKIYDIKNDGVYYWRVTAINAEGFPGLRSLPRVIKVITDNAAPYLSVHNPKEKQIVKQQTVTIEGETENFVELFLAGKKIDIDTSGFFRTEVSLKPGNNTLVFSLIDPAANTDTVRKNIYYAPYRTPKLQLAGGINNGTNSFLTNKSFFRLSGVTDSLSQVIINGKDAQKYFAHSDSLDGSFSALLNLSEGSNPFSISILTALGDTLTRNFSVTLDSEAPEINLLSEVPAVAAQEELTIKAKVTGAEYITVNSVEVPAKNGEVNTKIRLATGWNHISIIAFDKTGNQSRLDKSVLFDKQLPVSIKSSLSLNTVVPGDVLLIDISVDRLSFETQRVVQYEMEIGGKKITGMLKYSDANNKFTGYISVPENTAGKPKLTKVSFQSSAGEKKEIPIN